MPISVSYPTVCWSSSFFQRRIARQTGAEMELNGAEMGSLMGFSVETM